MPSEHVPVIPSDATRIRLGSLVVCLDAATAEAEFERRPFLREKEVEVDCGPTVLHVGGNLAMGWSAWSDGRILLGHVLPRTERPRRLTAVEESGLVHHFTSALFGQDELDPRLWMRWLDATGFSEEVVRSVCDERRYVADHHASRVIELRSFRLHFSDRPDELVWLLRERVVTALGEPFRGVDGPDPTDAAAVSRDRRLWLYADEAAALAQFAARDDGRPAIVTLQEAVPLLGTTDDALREALSRADDVVPRTAGVTGRTHWYVLEHLAEWLTARP
ncbi:hypothetical protein GCM10018781_78030 [Kitasatospora indigofera]|uniref:Uncharacterized protein n=1 Tax=Kitasatospora indigofera TaxID=67307 RepID=A0A918YXK0_9ACTN|nr:hypothetical protein [Kitasatospora indigofera]GHE26035.1 hypothetical protein GCM10018781_78030 [Kitasatospora indigofera]